MIATTDDGVRIAYTSTGTGDAVVLLHGTTATHAIWDRQVPAFAQRFQVIVPDLRGSGDSDVPDDPSAYSVARFARDITAVLDDAHVERAHVVGLSLGGAVALRFALDFPERIQTLQLLGAWARTDEFLKRIFFEPIGQALERGAVHETFRYGLGLIMSPAYLDTREPSEVADVITDVFIQHPITAAGFRGQLTAGRLHDESARLGSVAVPTAVFVGELDANVPPRYAQQLAAGIPGAKLTIFRGPRASHCANLEMPDTFNRCSIDFLDSPR